MRVEQEIVDTYLLEDGDMEGRIAIRLTSNPMVVLEDGEIICGVALAPGAARRVAFALLEFANESEARFGKDEE